MKKQRGFTLIEILIVVIILAILASMVLPRFMGQTENAYIAEAQQTLGVLRAAITTALDQGLTVAAPTTTADMPILGLKAIPATNFTYTCATPSTSCTATSTRNTAATITLTLAGVYSCDGAQYALISTSKGCRPAA